MSHAFYILPALGHSKHNLSVMKPIHVAYAEDHSLLRISTSNLLKERGFIVSDFSNGKEMLEQLQDMLIPDICIININMPQLNGFETTQLLRKQFPSVKVLIYSISDYDPDIIKILSMGANGYLIKNGNVDELCKAILSVYEKGFYIDDEVSKVVLKHLKRMKDGSGF
jgi:DNA-binding NarL/FixJ family response regulator